MGDFNAVKYKNDFAKEKYDRIAFNVPKGQSEVIKQYAKEHGYKSLNNFIWQCIQNAMDNNVKNISIGEINQTGDNNSVHF